MDQPETVHFPLSCRIVLVRDHTLLEQRPQRACTQQRRKHMVTMDDIITPDQDSPPYPGYVCKIHPRSPALAVTIQDVAIHAGLP